MKSIKDNIHVWLILIISFGFYIFFFFLDGYVLCADSNTYIIMEFAREPLYSLYLGFFRTLFANQENFYLLVAVLGQCLLAGYSSYYITTYFMKVFNLSAWLGYAIVFLTILPSLMCRFLAKRGSMYSNSILTEGITISLYLLLICYCLEYLLYKTKKSFLISTMICFFAISCRKHMIVCLMILFAVIIIAHYKKEIIKGIGKGILAVVCVLLSVSMFDKGYNYIMRGEFVKHVEDNRFVATMIFYTADRDFCNYIEDDEVKKVFLDVYDICEEKGYLMHQSSEGWLNEVTHFGDNYDYIQLDTLCVYLDNNIKDIQYRNDISSDEIRADLIKSEIIHSLFPHEIDRLIRVVFNNFLSGLVTTVAKRTPLLCIYSIFVYIIYIAMFTYLCIVRKTEMLHKEKQRLNAILNFSALTILSIIINVGIVSMVIFCQTRYTIYNMSLFYISFLLMLYEIYQVRLNTVCAFEVE